MVSETLKEILRCPNCVRTTGGELKLHKDAWFICNECGRKYPIVDDIPVMLIDEGDKWVKTAEAELPVPPLRNNVTTLQELLNDLTGGDEDARECGPCLARTGRGCDPCVIGFDPLSGRGLIAGGHYASLQQSPLCRTEWLVPFLSNDPAPEVRQCAALGLAGKADESATQPLVHALNDEDSMVGSLAATALVKIGSAAVPSLIETVKQWNAIRKDPCIACAGRDQGPSRHPDHDEGNAGGLCAVATLGEGRLGPPWPGYGIYKTGMKNEFSEKYETPL